MSLLIMPLLTTPLLKVPLSITRALCVQIATTPPNPPPLQSEMKKFGAQPDTLSKRSGAWKTATGMRFVLWCTTLCETAVIVAEMFPSTVSDKVLSLLPHPPSAAALCVSPVFFAGWLFTCTGALIRMSCFRTLGRLFTWELAVRDNHRLVTTGPYSIVRHPSYTGSTLVGIGNLLCAFGPGSYWVESGFLRSPVGRVLGTAWLVYWIFIPALLWSRVNKEDAVLKKEFGKEWEAWAKKTPYKLLPFVY
ncbi:putative protein-S-isoprenylcysteine O-methyltransferase [Grifola frondosa]|uniref:Protein-S-isoprenylcysteine O-methyltransferase n=1 Tax=Grifola frondosa TaxID=5627 RepID=A0A1C7MET0_GRIFR|nr:putative protein-S-isoprenylcysteine O-methyltransferase [Grifola frondosa]